MEYSGETIQLYESMASAGTLKTYNDITTVVSITAYSYSAKLLLQLLIKV